MSLYRNANGSNAYDVYTDYDNFTNKFTLALW